MNQLLGNLLVGIKLINTLLSFCTYFFKDYIKNRLVVGNMLEAFTILTNAMFKKGDQNLTQYGRFKQSYVEAANL